MNRVFVDIGYLENNSDITSPNKYRPDFFEAIVRMNSTALDKPITPPIPDYLSSFQMQSMELNESQSQQNSDQINSIKKQTTNKLITTNDNDLKNNINEQKQNEKDKSFFHTPSIFSKLRSKETKPATQQQQLQQQQLLQQNSNQSQIQSYPTKQSIYSSISIQNLPQLRISDKSTYPHPMTRSAFVEAVTMTDSDISLRNVFLFSFRKIMKAEELADMLLQRIKKTSNSNTDNNSINVQNHNSNIDIKNEQNNEQNSISLSSSTSSSSYSSRSKSHFNAFIQSITSKQQTLVQQQQQQQQQSSSTLTISERIRHNVALLLFAWVKTYWDCITPSVELKILEILSEIESQGEISNYVITSTRKEIETKKEQYQSIMNEQDPIIEQQQKYQQQQQEKEQQKEEQQQQNEQQKKEQEKEYEQHQEQKQKQNEQQQLQSKSISDPISESPDILVKGSSNEIQIFYQKDNDINVNVQINDKPKTLQDLTDSNIEQTQESSNQQQSQMIQQQQQTLSSSKSKSDLTFIKRERALSSPSIPQYQQLVTPFNSTNINLNKEQISDKQSDQNLIQNSIDSTSDNSNINKYQSFVSLSPAAQISVPVSLSQSPILQQQQQIQQYQSIYQQNQFQSIQQQYPSKSQNLQLSQKQQFSLTQSQTLQPNINYKQKSHSFFNTTNINNKYNFNQYQQYQQEISPEVIDPLFVSHRLTLIEETLFRQISVSEFVGQGWVKRDKLCRSPSICRLINHFNRTTRWVPLVVLSFNKERFRAEAYDRFIRSAEELIHIQNYYGAYEIFLGLQHRSVTRLKKTLKKLKNQKKLDSIKSLYSNPPNYPELKIALKQAKPPLLPLLPVFLHDLIIFEEWRPFIRKRKEFYVNQINKNEIIMKNEELEKQTQLINNEDKIQQNRLDKEFNIDKNNNGIVEYEDEMLVDTQRCILFYKMVDDFRQLVRTPFNLPELNQNNNQSSYQKRNFPSSSFSSPFSYFSPQTPSFFSHSPNQYNYQQQSKLINKTNNNNNKSPFHKPNSDLNLDSDLNFNSLQTQTQIQHPSSSLHNQLTYSNASALPQDPIFEIISLPNQFHITGDVDEEYLMNLSYQYEPNLALQQQKSVTFQLEQQKTQQELKQYNESQQFSDKQRKNSKDSEKQIQSENQSRNSKDSQKQRNSTPDKSLTPQLHNNESCSSISDSFVLVSLPKHNESPKNKNFSSKLPQFTVPTVIDIKFDNIDTNEQQDECKQEEQK